MSKDIDVNLMGNRLKPKLPYVEYKSKTIKTAIINVVIVTIKILLSIITIVTIIGTKKIKCIDIW